MSFSQTQASDSIVGLSQRALVSGSQFSQQEDTLRKAIREITGNTPAVLTRDATAVNIAYNSISSGSTADKLARINMLAFFWDTLKNHTGRPSINQPNINIDALQTIIRSDFMRARIISAGRGISEISEAAKKTGYLNIGLNTLPQGKQWDQLFECANAPTQDKINPAKTSTIVNQLFGFLTHYIKKEVSENPTLVETNPDLNRVVEPVITKAAPCPIITQAPKPSIPPLRIPTPPTTNNDEKKGENLPLLGNSTHTLLPPSATNRAPIKPMQSFDDTKIPTKSCCSCNIL